MATQLFVSFLGVCVHVNNTLIPGRENIPGERVVLPNCATINTNEPPFQGVSPHLARMQFGNTIPMTFEGPPLTLIPFETSDLVSFTNIGGAQLEVVNPLTPGAPAIDVGCLPHLSTWLPGAAPGPAVLNPNSTDTGATFEITSGTLVGVHIEQGAGIAQYTVVTNGNPQLKITPFAGGSPTIMEFTPNRVVDGNDQVSINVMNLPSDTKDDGPADFLLSYLAANAMPVIPPNPTAATCPLTPIQYGIGPNPAPGATDIPFTADPNCSNSNIP